MIYLGFNLIDQSNPFEWRMENGDDWVAFDKLQHVLFGFFITIFVSLLIRRTPYSFLRRRSIWIGCILSFSAGVAKEMADEFGFFNSAGASVKDVVADLLGILLAVAILSGSKSMSPQTKFDPSGKLEIV